MRIGIYTGNYPGLSGYGGIGTYTRALAESLEAAGNSVHVVLGSPSIEQNSRHINGVRIHAINTQYLRGVDRFVPGFGVSFKVARAIRHIVKQNGIELFEFPNWDGFGILVPTFSSLPFVVRLHTSTQESMRVDGLDLDRESTWAIRREHWQAKGATALVTHSDAHRSHMSKELDIEESEIDVIPHGVPTFPNYNRPNSNGSAPSIVSVGRLEKRKGTVDLIDAAAHVLNQCPHATITLIGNDRNHCPGNQSHADYASSVLKPEHRKQLRFLGELEQDRVDELVQSADIFVAPSVYESFGLIFPEAMRWGTPVIGTTVGGIPEIITDGVSGLLVPPSSPVELGNAIVRLLKDAPLRARLGREGRRVVESRFSTDQMAQSVSQYYAQVIDRYQEKS